MVAESVTSRQNDSRSLLVVDVQGNQRGGFCIVSVEIIMMQGKKYAAPIIFSRGKMRLLSESGLYLRKYGNR